MRGTSKSEAETNSPYIKSFSDTCKTRLAIIERHLQRREYNFGKWKATLIPKKDGGGEERPLIIPKSISDKLVLKAMSDYLSDFFSPIFDRVGSVSYAYQKRKSTRDALIQLKRIHKPENILLKIDIKHFLMKSIRQFLLTC